MSITLEDIRTALAIVENSEGSEITLRSGDIELIVRRGPAGFAQTAVPSASADAAGLLTHQAHGGDPGPAAVAPSTTRTAGASSPGAPSATAVALRAPLSGVIYRAPSPEEAPFVIPGASVDPDTIVCIIDVMKVMNLIKSPAAGRISRIDAEDGQVVAKNDIILWVEPS